MRHFIKPTWIVLAIIVAGFAYLCFTLLAPWQLGKNRATQERNQQIEQALDIPPAPIGELLKTGTLDSADEWRIVTLTGHYLPEATALTRLRSSEGTPAFEVLTTFVTDSGITILIDRGYAYPSDNASPPQVPAVPGTPLTLRGHVRLPEHTPANRPALQVGSTSQFYAIDPVVVGREFKTPLARAYVMLSAGQSGVLDPVALPQLEDGPYLSYGLQWLAFGVMAPLGLAYFAWSEIRERRAERATEHPGSGSGSEPTPRDKLADRYGRKY